MEKSSSTRDSNQHKLTERTWDWRLAFLTIALVEISSTRLVITKWASYLYFTQTIAGVGVLLGLAIGYSYFSRKAAIRLALGYTMILIPAQLIKAVEEKDWLWQEFAELFNRLFTSLSQLIRNQPVYDQLFFVSLVTLGYWIIGICAGYWLTRHGNFLGVILPAGVAMLIVQVFDPYVPTRAWGLAVYIFTALLLLGRMYLLESRSSWKKTQFLLTPETINDFDRGVFAVAAAAVFIAWALPGWISSVKPAAQAWRDFSRPLFDRLSDAVSALEAPGKKTSGDFYSGTLALGQQATINDTPIFYVEVEKNNFTPVRNYWKGRVYDLYLDGRWTTLSNLSTDFNPEANEISIEYPEARHEMAFTFTNNAMSQNLLYSPAETIWTSREGSIVSTPISTRARDVTAWFSVPSLLSGNSYKTRALIADPSIDELRAAGTDYPKWVTAKYLQIPETIAPQLRELALEITAPYDTPYDKAQAITAYLRKEIEYTTEITETLPDRQDPVLWVLFDHKKGFCMYYASAETLMLRSIGIPARMAVGFAEGTRDKDSLKERYIVAYKNSHAWPEVYFPGIGWMEFEPTANQDPLNRPQKKIETNANASDAVPQNGDLAAIDGGEQNSAEFDPTLLEDENLVITRQTNSWAKFLASAGIFTILILGIFLARRYSLEDRLPVYLADRYTRNGNTPPRWLNRWVRWVSLSPIEQAFQAISFSLYWLKHPQPIHTTSQERANILMTHLPSAQEQILFLLQEYQTAIYTPRPGNITIARKAATIILLKTWQSRVKKALKFMDTRYNQLQ